MAYIVNGNQRIYVRGWDVCERRHEKTRNSARYHVAITHDIHVYCNQKRLAARLLEDVALIQKHFGGISRSAAGRLSIALTANAIRKNKALPDLNDPDVV
jgi:hypothetical protein